jgi:pyruvate formate lyase activating enzyme
LGSDIILRIPIIPGINDKPNTLIEAAQLAAALPILNHIDLLPYHPSAAGKYKGLKINYRLPDVTTPAEEQMEKIATFFRSYGLTVHIGG